MEIITADRAGLFTGAGKAVKGAGTHPALFARGVCTDSSVIPKKRPLKTLDVRRPIKDLMIEEVVKKIGKISLK